ncbi:hypothetical protein N7493_005995 [Penicillium malachiteum]|uniref:Uncharacterized protein n=1 Tax=Penicillium malachiteum TaxID=1324776 RepID=A0AAD6HLM6_9EURO|nr:hypothetical protein N7493_005995 [Penicillium malachiteum]
MAHQAHNIPWSLLASNLHWSTVGGPNAIKNVTNLRPSMKPNQGKELTYFVEAFARNIEDHSLCEREKYPLLYEPADPTDLILDSALVQKITPTVRKWLSEEDQTNFPMEFAMYITTKRNANVFPSRMKREKHWHFCGRLVKTLILHDEMNAILRVCALPGVRLQEWWENSECPCNPPLLGWDQIALKALRAYICLNTIYCLPEIWDYSSGRNTESDYRNSKFYQYTLRTCTGTGQVSEVSAYPHRQFFGIGDTQLGGEFVSPKITGEKAHWVLIPNGRHPKTKYYSLEYDHYSKLSIGDFLTLEDDSLPGWQTGQSDIALVQDYLYRKGLPMELVLEIMSLAKYEPLGRLSEPHDPFHSSNQEELAKYLKNCW